MPKIAPPAETNPEDHVFLDEKLRMAWERYGTFVYVFSVVVIVGILGREGLRYLSAQKELGIEKEYAEAHTPDAQHQFVSLHRGHPLASLLEMRFADEDFQTAKYEEAIAAYSKAVADLPPGPFQDRSRLGLAMSQARAGKTSDAETGLRLILNDEGQLKSIRCEAGYALAELAVAAGNAADVQKLAERLMQIDPTSPFAERAFSLRADIVTSPAAPAGQAPAIAVPAAH
jgi:hypothetical protein